MTRYNIGMTKRFWLKAVLKHDRATSTCSFYVRRWFSRMHIIYKVPARLTKIERLLDYDEGSIIMQTNYGEEYTDLIEVVESSVFVGSYRNKFIKMIMLLRLEDIQLI